MRPIISPRDLAAAIGVSESSLKRWADDGLFQVSRTAGGHRRIAVGEAIRFIRSIHAPILRPDLLGLSDLTAGGEHVYSADAPAERLFSYLREGRARDARGLVLSLYLSGQSVVEIADGPIQSAMERLGEMWQHDEAGIFVEHRATDICIQAVQQLRQLVEPQQPRALAVGGAPPGDPYLLASLLAATALGAEGWQAMNLGPDTPFEALLKAAERSEPRLVWLSASVIRDESEFVDGVVALSKRLAEREVPLVVGGRGVTPALVPSGALIHTGRTLGDLIAVAGAQACASSIPVGAGP